MPRPSRLTIAKNDILRHFDELAKRVFTPSEIAQILSEQRAFWRLATNTNSSQFIEYLQAQDRLRKVAHALRVGRCLDLRVSPFSEERGLPLPRNRGVPPRTHRHHS